MFIVLFRRRSARLRFSNSVFLQRFSRRRPRFRFDLAQRLQKYFALIATDCHCALRCGEGWFEFFLLRERIGQIIECGARVGVRARRMMKRFFRRSEITERVRGVTRAHARAEIIRPAPHRCFIGEMGRA